jgi:hypothetical protein
MVIRELDIKIGHREAGDGERDAQAVARELFDIIRRVAARAFAEALDFAFETVEAKEKGMVEQGKACGGCHGFYPPLREQGPLPEPACAAAPVFHRVSLIDMGPQAVKSKGGVCG